METMSMIKTRADLGVHPIDKGYKFCVWAPNAKAVYLSGEFNNWAKKELIMTPEAGYWSAEVSEAEAGQQYEYIIETPAGELLYRPDPYARMMTNSVGKSIITQDDFNWEGDDFQIPNWYELVIYEMHIGTFHVKAPDQPGTFSSAIEKLPYLQKLGINAIEVMPISEFAGDYSWGYNPAHPYAVEEAYGGAEGFKKFVKAAHQHGIAVILDVVYNHFGPSDLGLWQFDGWNENDLGGIYFYNDWRSETPWGDTRPDYGRAEVRQYIYDNALMWLEEYHCDGLRMDMVPYMRTVRGDESDEIGEGYSLIRKINGDIREKYPQKLIIAEDLHGHDFITDSVDEGGCGYGAQWDADFVHPVRAMLTLAEDSQRDLHKIADAIRRTYSGDSFRRVIYTESHDEIANGSARLTEEISSGDVDNYFSKKRSALGAVLVLTSPGIPMLFQGQEILEDKWFSDQDPIDWKRLKEFKGIHRLYRDLITFRRNLGSNTKGLGGVGMIINHLNNDTKILAFTRWWESPEEDGVLIVINFSNNPLIDYQIGLPAQNNWELLFNSDEDSYDKEFDDQQTGNIEVLPTPYDHHEQSGKLNIGAYSAQIYVPQC